MRRDMTTVANNIANASTNGFRGEQTLFQEYLARTGTIGQRDRVSMTQDIGQYRNLQEGPIQVTGNQLDLALKGDGFFVIGNPGQDYYARTGSFTVDAEGKMLTADGYPILQENGAPVVLGANPGKVNVTSDGVVSADGREVGRLRLVRFQNEQAMRRTSNGFYTTDEAPRPASDTKVIQSALEGSNVQPVLEITRMIEMLRDYQSTQKMIEAENDRMRNAINKLARSS